MSKIKYCLYDGRAEIISYCDTASAEMELHFPTDVSGYVQIGEVVKKISDGVCHFKAERLSDEELHPTLILENDRIELPPIVKKGAGFAPLSPDEEYIRELSIRELKLAERVKRLEKTISQIEKKVYGTTIF